MSYVPSMKRHFEAMTFDNDRIGIMSKDETPSTTLSHNGISFGLYQSKACGGCGADNWRGEKLALAHIEEADSYLCPPCVRAYFAAKPLKS